MNPENLIGRRFGSLTVISRAENSRSGKARWNCVCDCGATKKIPVCGYDLKVGKVSSCGCLRKITARETGEKNEKHGKTHTRLYGIWQGMKRRCNPNNSYSPKSYRNITVCYEWMHDFHSFYDWAMSNGYADNLTIDRIDVYGNYSPDNCRWATYKEQENNRRNNHFIIYKGEKYTLAQLSEKLNLSQQALRFRINSGWSEEQLSLPVSADNRSKRRYTL